MSAPGVVCHTLAGGTPIAAVLFDVDGTLYAQGPLRRRMALELAKSVVVSPLGARQRIAALRAFRHAQERLRESAVPVTMQGQIDEAARESGVPSSEIGPLVDEWMFNRPLPFLAGKAAAGLAPLLTFLEQRGVRRGVLSDYPANAKLDALGLAGRFSPILCATDQAVGAFKPDPRGFLEACRIWQLAPDEVLYVGDRADVDAVGAAAAGMPSVIVSAAPIAHELPAGASVLPSFERLHRVLADGC